MFLYFVFECRSSAGLQKDLNHQQLFNHKYLMLEYPDENDTSSKKSRSVTIRVKCILMMQLNVQSAIKKWILVINAAVQERYTSTMYVRIEKAAQMMTTRAAETPPTIPPMNKEFDLDCASVSGVQVPSVAPPQPFRIPLHSEELQTMQVKAPDKRKIHHSSQYVISYISREIKLQS